MRRPGLRLLNLTGITMTSTSDTDSQQASRRARLGTPSRDSFAWCLAAFAGALILIAWALLGLDFWQKDASNMTAASERAAAIARTMDERVVRSVRLADQLLRLVGAELQATSAWSDARAVERILHRLEPQQDEILTISLIDAQGLCIGHSNPALRAGVSYGDSDFFRAHSAAATPGLFVEEPMFGPVSGQRVFTVSRRLSATGGAFLGVIVAVIRTDALATDFASASIGPRGAATLFHIPSQRIVVRQPDYPATFARILRYPFLQDQLAQIATGNFKGASSLDGEERLYAYRRIGDLPLAVSVGLSTGELRADLRQEFVGHLLLALLLTVVVGGGAVHIFATYRRETGLLESMRSAREFFEHTFEAAPVGMTTIDLGGHYTRVNQAMCQFTGYSASELLTMTDLDISYPEDVEQSGAARQSMQDGGCRSLQMEKRYLRKDGSEIWALLVMSMVTDAAGRPLYVLEQMLDIDGLKRAEHALRISEQRFRGIFENANTGIAAVNPGGHLLYFNEAFRAMLGHDAETLQQMHYTDFSLPEDLARETALFAEVLQRQRDRYRIEKRYVASDGRLLWVDLHVSTICDAQGEIVALIGVISDISTRKESVLALADSGRQLRALASHQEENLELERKHIAREVHDELGQLLTALKMDISLIRLRFGGNLPLLAMVDEMRSLVEKTIEVVRNVASNLRPAALDHGLVPALDWLAEDFARRWSIRCRLEVNQGEMVLDDLQSTAIFRVVQESLTNVARHAQASEVLISLRQSSQVLYLLVKDDGRGFATLAGDPCKGFGLFGMRERLLALGGTLRIDSTPGAGTRVSIELPLLQGEPP